MHKLSWVALVVVAAACGRGFEPQPPGVTPPQPLTRCETLDRAACGARSDCAAQDLACAAVCLDDGHGGCQPCGGFQCVTVTPPQGCSALDANTCTTHPECRLESPVCVCATNSLGQTECPPCASEPRCVDAVPAGCGSFDPNTCALHPECRLESVSACTCAVDPSGNTSCPPCMATPVCVDAVVDTCAGIDIVACSARSDCAVTFGGACPACPPNALCAPCDAQFSCVPAALPSPCFGLDLASCSTDSRCEVVSYACTTECRDDGQGGCLPCDVPAPSCQPRDEGPVAGCGSGGGQPPFGP